MAKKRPKYHKMYITARANVCLGSVEMIVQTPLASAGENAKSEAPTLTVHSRAYSVAVLGFEQQRNTKISDVAFGVAKRPSATTHLRPAVPFSLLRFFGHAKK